jgi:hypothetical protein
MARPRAGRASDVGAWSGEADDSSPAKLRLLFWLSRVLCRFCKKFGTVLQILPHILLYHVVNLQNLPYSMYT